MKLAANSKKIFSGRVVGIGLGKQAFVGSGLVALLCLQAFAGPEGERVVNGSAQFTRNGSTTVIQASNNTIIDYRSFNIGVGETVQFVQPGSTSRVLNRVPDAVNPTRIDGTLTANGMVYIVNSAGVYFGNRAVVNAAGIYAAAGTITNQDFLSNVNHFTNMSGTVSNAGTINAGTVALLGKHAENLGTINAERGLVTMAAGDDIYIGEVGGTMMVQVSGAGQAATAAPGVNNAGTINAEGGSVRLAAGDMYSLALKMPGRIAARDVKLDAQGHGTAIVSGTIDASSTRAGERGGTVQVLGDRVGISGARIDASGPAGGGEVLIGGDFQGRGDVRTASQTVVTRDSVIRADATQHGDGGKVIVWADGTTRYAGDISVKSSGQGGNGGFVEVSGKRNLDFKGRVDLLGTGGADGTLLLDPDNIIIQAAVGGDDGEVGGADGDVLFGDGAGTFTIGRAAIESITGNILLQANVDITVNTDLTLSNQTTGESVVFTAGNNITINGAITTSGASITFNANDAAGTQSGTGSIFINNDLSTAGVDGNAGDITLNLDGGTGLVQLSAGLQTDGGNITIAELIEINSAIVSLDTEVGSTGAAGNINLSGSTIRAEASSASQFALMLDLTSGGGADGNATLGVIGGAGGAFLNMLLVQTDAQVTLTGDISLDSAGVDLSNFIINAGSVVLTNSITIDTEQGNDGSAGDASFAFFTPISANAAGIDLIIDTSTTNGDAGGIDFGGFDNAGGFYVNDVTLITGGSGADGNVELLGDVLLDADGLDTARFTLSGGGALLARGGPITIDTEQGDDADGGDVNLNASSITSDTSGRDLTISTGTAAVGGTAGNITFGAADSSGGALLNDLTFNIGAANSGFVQTAGNITVDSDFLDDSSVTFIGGGTLVINSNTTIKTEVGDDGNGGNVDFGTTVISGGAPGHDLTIDTSTAAGAASAGDVTLGAVNGSGGGFINDLTITATGATSGRITLGGTILVDANGGDAATVSMTGSGAVLAASITIDTEQGDDGDGGALDLDGVLISADAAGRNLFIDTGSSGGNGGNVSLGAFDGSLGDFVNDLQVYTSSSGAHGDITLNGNILLDGSGGFAAAGDDLILASSITIDTEQGDDGAGGNIALGGVRIVGNAFGRDLTLNTSTAAAAAGGAVGLGQFAAGGLFFVNDVSINTGGGLSAGTVTVPLSISIDAAPADTATFTVAGGGNILFTDSVTIDTEQGNNASGGAIDFGTSQLTAGAPGIDVTLNTGSTAVATTGGTVTLGSIGNAGGEFLNDVVIDTDATGSDGALLLGGNIALDGNAADAASFAFIGGEFIVNAASVTIDTETGGDEAGGAVSLIAGVISATLTGNDLTIDTSTSGAGAGGAIQIGAVGNGTVNFVNDLTLNSGGAGGAGSVTLAGSIRLNNNAADAGSLTVTGGGNIVASVAVDIDTEQGDNGDAGDVNFGSSVLTSAFDGLDITINASSAGNAGGAVTLGTLNNAGGSFFNDVSITTTGTLTLNGSISLDANGGDLSSFAVTSAPIVLGGSVTIDTEQGNNAAGGSVDLGTGGVSAGAVGRDLTINTATSSAGAAGGAVTLGAFNATGGASVNDVTITRAGGSGGTNGTITLNGDIALDANAADTGDFTVSDAGNITFTASRLIDTEQANNSAAGDINLGQATISVSSAGLDLTLDASTSAVGAAGGDVTLPAIGTAGGAALRDLTVAAAGGAGGTGGVLTIPASIQLGFGAGSTGDFVVVAGTASMVLSGDTTIDTDVSGGTSDAGDVSIPASVTINGANSLTIDLTADGGGASGDLALLSTIGNSTRLTNLTLLAASIDLGEAHVTGNVTLVADDIDLVGGSDTIDSNGVAGTISLAPTAAGVSIRVGGSGAGTLVLDTTDIAAIGTFNGGIVIGRADGTALTNVSTATFASDTTIRQGGAGGTIAFVAGSTVATSNNSSLTLLTGAGGSITQGAGATINSGGGDLAFTTDTIQLDGGADTITTTGAITFLTATANRSIVIGNPGGASDLALDDAEIAAFTDGSDGFTFGDINAGNDVAIGEVTFNDSLTILVPQATGDINIVGDLTGTGTTAFRFDGSGSTVTLSADIVGTGDGSVTFDDNVIVDGARSITLAGGGANGAVTFNGTVDGTAVGGDTLSITSSGGALSVVSFADDIGATTRLGGLQVITPQVELGGDVLITGGGDIDLFSNNIIVAGTTLFDTDASGGADNAGDILLFAASSLNTSAGGSNITLDATADGGGTSGNITLGTVGDTGPNRPVNFSALGQDVTLNGDITTAGDTIIGLGTGTVTLATPSTIDNTAGTNNLITVHHVSGNSSLTITGDSGSQLTLTGADVDTLTLTGGALLLSGTIETDTDQDYSNVGPITLQGATTLIARDSDAANALQDITTDVGNLITGAQTLTVTGNNISLAAIGDTSTDPTVLTVSGAGNVTLGDVSVGTAAVTADSDASGAGTFTVSSGSTFAVASGALNLTAADVALDGTISAASSDVRIERSADGDIGVGDAAGDMSISKAELANITADSLTIGSSTRVADILVDNVAAADLANIGGNFTLDATGNGASVTFQNAASTFENLTVVADDAVHFNVDVSTTGGDLTVDGDADDAADSSDNITFADGVSVESAGNLTLSSTTGDMIAAGGLTLTGADGVTINDSILTGGLLTIDADTDDDADGTLSVATGAAVATGGANADITAADIVLDGTLNAGAGSIDIERSTLGAIRLGGTSLMGELGISNAELTNIAAAGLVLGGSNTNLIEVESIASGESAGITGITQLNATADGGRVRFITDASTFTTLSVTADDGIIVEHDLTTTTGDMSFNPNADAADDTDDRLSLADNVDLTSGMDLLVAGDQLRLTGASGTTNIFTSNGDGNVSIGAIGSTNDVNVIINSQNNISVGGVTINGGAFTAAADTDADGSASLATAGVSAGSVDLAGGSDNNDIIDVNLGITANNGIAIHNAATVNVGGGVTLTTTTGAIDINNAVGNIVLTGADNTTVTFTSDSGGIGLAPISATNSPNLTIETDGVTAFTSVDLNAGDLAVNATLAAPTGLNVTIEAGDVAFSRNAGTTSGGVMSINNSGTLSLIGSPVFTIDGGFAQIGTGDTNLSGSITTSNDAITFAGPVILTGPVTLDTGAGAGDITFASTVRSDSSDSKRALSLASGTGNITFSGTVGANGALDQLLIQLANNVSFASDVTANSIRQVAGAGTTTFGGTTISQGSGGIDLDGNIFDFVGGIVTLTQGAGFSLTNTGTATFQNSSTVALAGAFLQDGTGAVNLNAPITTSLAPITFTGPVSIAAPITIANNGAGDINFGSTLTTTQPVTIDSGVGGSANINFNGAVTSTGELVTRTGTGAITFVNNVTANSALTAATTTGAISFNGPLSIAGALSATSTSGIISFAGAVTAGSAFAVTTQSSNILFSAAVNGAAAGSGIFNLNAGTGDVVFNSGANVGGTTPVQRFTATARNITVRSITTQGTNASGDGDITLVPDLTVTQNVVTEFPDQIERDNRPNGLVRIDGNLVANNGDINVGAAGRSVIPSVATTIVGDPAFSGGSLPTFTIAANGGNVNFGAFDKLTSFGNLSLVGVNITFSDIASLGVLSVNAGNNIVLRLRAGALLLRPGAGDTFLRNQIDFGSNIVANGGIGFTAGGAVLTTGSGELPSFAASNGVGTGLPSNFLVAIRSPFSAGDLRSAGVALSIDARGTTDTGLASALASAIPRDTEIGNVAETTSLGQAEKDQLRELYINPRDLRETEVLDFLSGRSLYEDVVLEPNAAPDEFLVSVNRLPLGQVMAVLETYREVFKKPRLDENGEQMVDAATGRPLFDSRDREIREELTAALRRFRKEGREGTLDPVEFRRYLERTPEESAALGHVEAMQSFFEQLHLLGLGPKEEENSKRSVLGRVRPSGITVQQLEQTVMAPEEAAETLQ